MLLELGNRKFWLFSFMGYAEEELKLICNSILYLINRIRTITMYESAINTIDNRGDVLFIRLVIGESITIDTGIYPGTYPYPYPTITQTHRLVVKDGNFIDDPKIGLAYIGGHDKIRGHSRIFINGLEEEEEYIDYLYFSSLTLEFINNVLKQYFPQYELTSFDRVEFKDGYNRTSLPLEMIPLDYQISVEFLRDVYVASTLLDYDWSRSNRENLKYEYKIVIRNKSFDLPFNNQLLDLLEGSTTSLGLYLLFRKSQLV